MHQILKLQELASEVTSEEEGVVEVSTPSVLLCIPPSIFTH
ncbi:hypothetical protein [Streptomyces sparsogenes]|nr:hypothetical protein [Streptomyces sparsogenes]